jgi:DNA replication and repair protein RecF
MLTRLALTDFRSYPEALILPGPGLVVLTGENGAGKTNVLEAVSMLAPGRGLRGATLGDMARQGGAGGWSVAADMGDDVRLGTGTRAEAPERRVVRINGAAASAAALAEWLSVLWITPAMDRLFTDPASGRRRFLDRLVMALEPGHAVAATRYEAAMRERNRLLAQERPVDPDWLAGIEAQMAMQGQLVAAARARTVAALATRLAGGPDGLFPRATLALDGWNGDESEKEAASRLARSRARDAAAGRALEGPHRQDLRVTHAGKTQPAERCSTGEQKALLLGLILGHADLVAARSGRRPILLLDEVAAHLDRHRRAALFDRLALAGGQVWMTGTDPELFADAPPAVQHLTVAAGTIS